MQVYRHHERRNTRQQQRYCFAIATLRPSIKLWSIYHNSSYYFTILIKSFLSIHFHDQQQCTSNYITMRLQTGSTLLVYLKNWNFLKLNFKINFSIYRILWVSGNKIVFKTLYIPQKHCGLTFSKGILILENDNEMLCFGIRDT